ncbi:MAG: DUF1501 domain-containing protein [Planctomycetota bacterium]|nr:DUF1501 domain-containing protein [Planctomycetota bacterium]
MKFFNQQTGSTHRSRLRTFSRRDVLRHSAVGFGNLALNALVSADPGISGAAPGNKMQGRSSSQVPHLPARAKRVIFLFMKGGPSHLDTFDYKPQLQKDDGKPLPFAKPRVQFAKTSTLLKSPWKFSPYGESGMLVSELFPNVAKQVDDICFLHSVHGTNAAHGGALLKLHTGSDNFVRPSMGSWITFGLGTENNNLPGFITICPTLAHGGVKNWSSAFLPADYQGTPLGVASQSSTMAKLKYAKGEINPELQRQQLDLLSQLNRDHLEKSGFEASLAARMKSFELAFRMQTEVPALEDISDESAETLRLYGLHEKSTQEFGRQCLLARRFAEKGVRFIQVTHSDSKVQWDQHADLINGHTKNAREVDQPIAGLLVDLKRRGMLDDTLVLWGGEFGRTPVAENKNGRDHNPQGFTMWMCGGGVRGGYRYGATDDYGYYAVQDKMHVHDLHATLLYLLGIDHQKLTYRYAGRDFRLTDVSGEVARKILA